MRIEIVPHTAPQAADVGAFAWIALLNSMKRAGAPIPQIVDSDAFSTLWAQGALVLAAAFDDDGKPVGCRVVAYTSHLLSSTVMVASGVLVFVSEPYRRRGIGGELVRVVNEYMTRDLNVWQLDEAATTVEAREMFNDIGYSMKAMLLTRTA